jgi:hypothetical protein
MNSRRFTCFVVGLWLGGGLLMAWFAATSFRSADRLLHDKQYAAAPMVGVLGPAKARVLLRYYSAEQNRYYFETWETAQLFIGLGLFSYLLFGTTERKTPLIVVLLMMAAVAVQRFLLTPELASMSRALEFAPLGDASANTKKFWTLHSGYFALETWKCGLGLVLTIKMILSSRRRRSHNSGDEFDVIDKPNHRHVNR